MKKAEVVQKLMDRNEGLTQTLASKIVNDVFEVIADALLDGDSYNQDKFGTFKVVNRAPRKGRNPQTGEVVDIPAKTAVKFVVSGSLKDKLKK